MFLNNYTLFGTETGADPIPRKRDGFGIQRDIPLRWYICRISHSMEFHLFLFQYGFQYGSQYGSSSMRLEEDKALSTAGAILGAAY